MGGVRHQKNWIATPPAKLALFDWGPQAICTHFDKIE